MAAGDSKVSIANRALQLLGAGTIESLDQDDPNARTMNRAYDPVRRALLREYVWNFSIGRASIAASSTKTEYEDLNRFLLPNDYLRLLRQEFSVPNDSRRPDWQIEGSYIVTADASPLKIRYVKDEENPVAFDASFSELLAARLAMETNQEVTGSENINRRAERAESRALAFARQANAFENEGDIPFENEWIEARR